MRYRLTVAYRGTAYHGWQRQLVAGDDTGAAELPTVQNVLRLALQRIVNHPVTIVGASRTDAGVHAAGQAAHFDTSRETILPENLLRALNAKLPADVAVRAIERVPDDFDAIRDATGKAYCYRIFNGDPRDRDVFAGDASLPLVPRPPLDAEAMDAAARHVVGTHDFASFAKPGHGRESTVRTITSCRVTRSGRDVAIDVAGTGFLWNQIRILAGTLLRVGTGHREPAWVADVLAAKDRQAAGPTAPACGLMLMRVEYPT